MAERVEMGSYFVGLACFIVSLVAWSVLLLVQRRKAPFTVAWTATLLGVLALLATFVARSFVPETPRLPLTTMFEIVLLVQLGSAAALLVVSRKSEDLRIAAPFVMAVVIALWVYGRTKHDPMEEHLQAALQSVWLQIHVATAILSYGPLFMSGVTSLMACVMFWRGAKWSAPRPPLEGSGDARPSVAEAFEEWTYRIVAFGFPWLTALIITGAVWANVAWGRAWGWDPKEMWSAITWLIYVVYLHARLRGGWRGAKASLVAALAWVAMLVTFVGVNWICNVLGLESLHKYSD